MIGTESFEAWMDYWHSMREMWRFRNDKVIDVLNHPEKYCPRPHEEHVSDTLCQARYFKAELDIILNKLMLSRPVETDTKKDVLRKWDLYRDLARLDLSIRTQLTGDD